MSGPDFEIPPLDPPRPPVDQPEPIRPKGAGGRRTRAAALGAVLGVCGVGALVWYAGQGSSTPQTPVTAPAPSTNRPLETRPTTTSTVVTTTTRAVAVTQVCVDSPASPGAAGGSFPDGFPWITFRASPRAAADALLRIAQASSDARAALGDAGALGVRVYCEVQEWATASGEPPGEVQQSVNDGLVAYMFQGDMWLYGPSFEKQSSASQRRTVYHEYFHAVQRSLSRLRSTLRNEADPLWLIEGSARLFENAVTPRDLQAFRDAQIRRWSALPALEALEQSGQAKVIGGTGDAYTVGAVAVDYLVNTYGRESMQSAFWLARAEGDWRSAFQRVFGRSVDAFYAEFAAYRETLRP